MMRSRTAAWVAVLVVCSTAFMMAAGSFGTILAQMAWILTGLSAAYCAMVAAEEDASVVSAINQPAFR